MRAARPVAPAQGLAPAQLLRSPSLNTARADRTPPSRSHNGPGPRRPLPYRGTNLNSSTTLGPVSPYHGLSDAIYRRYRAARCISLSRTIRRSLPPLPRRSLREQTGLRQVGVATDPARADPCRTADQPEPKHHPWSSISLSRTSRLYLPVHRWLARRLTPCSIHCLLARRAPTRPLLQLLLPRAPGTCRRYRAARW